MRYQYEHCSDWDIAIPGKLCNEINNLDKAHKRAKKELRKQQKALAKKNKWLDCYKYMLECSQKRERELELTNESLLKELARLKSEK